MALTTLCASIFYVHVFTYEYIDIYICDQNKIKIRVKYFYIDILHILSRLSEKLVIYFDNIIIFSVK